MASTTKDRIALCHGSTSVTIGKLKQLSILVGAVLSGVGIGGIITPVNALTFNFTPTATTSQQAIDGFVAAGNLWSARLTDNINVNINIDFSDLGTNTLGENSSSVSPYSYTQVYNALNSHKTSANDITAVNSLSNSSNFQMLINHTTNNADRVTPYLDNTGANTRTISLTDANAKALGLIASNASTIDASISFNNQLPFDFNHGSSITTGAYDFVGVATHEIGHALGFFSGVDVLDQNADLYRDNRLADVTALDLFR